MVGQAQPVRKMIGEFWPGNIKGGDHFRYLVIDCGIILKWMLKKWVVYWIRVA